MEILWLLGEGSVKEVHERVDPGRRLAYTTVMTVLDKMRRKGLLRYRKQSKAFLYSPAVGRTEVLAAALDDLIDTYFDGSRPDFMRFATEGSTAPEPAARLSQNATESQSAEIDEFLL
jgi:predicted transcriptional regulator